MTWAAVLRHCGVRSQRYHVRLSAICGPNRKIHPPTQWEGEVMRARPLRRHGLQGV
ncbi:hypothetical protein V7x_54460 [Crateriforma conspicua]|uniref:Uncharacterized protein n=1 Tax=Crateriforma conspicua TaxID=2527996 RepID=A0A5C6FFV7_9PLAN|nr:hypothetical protein V7x_54460 [Crateriforma conspicua]